MNKNLIVASIIAIIIIGSQFFFQGFSQEAIWETLKNLSYSFLAAIIFYLLQTILPERRLKNKARIILQNNINKLLDEFDFLIALTDKIISFDGDDIAISGLNDDYVYLRKEKGQPVIWQRLNYREYFQTCIKKIKDQIMIMKSNSLYSYLDENLITIIAEIEADNFPVISAVGQLYPKCTKFQNIQDDLNKLSYYYRMLSEYADGFGRWSIELLNEDEIADYKNDISKHKIYGDEINKYLRRTSVNM